MSTSIYSIPSWSSATVYKTHDIVLRDETSYYALADHTSSPAFDTDLNDGLWGGTALDSNGQTIPNFIWKPSYNSTVDNSPRVKKIQFGDGYQQRVEDGINNILIQLELTFDTRTIDEATAILHFLFARGGVEAFSYTPPPPYGRAKKFICSQWSDARNFYNSLTVRARFEEVVA